jgi:hypothetical protein
MLVYRETYIVKRGRMKEAIAMCVEISKGFAWPHAARIYHPYLSPLSILIWEAEVESVAEWEKMRAAFYAHASNPKHAGWEKKWNELLESGGNYEIWEVEK